MLPPLTACDLADAAYKTADLPTILQEIRNGSESCQVRVSETSGIVISPAGTNDKEDWKSNKDYGKSNFLGYGVHTGFLNGWQALAPELRDLIRDFAGYPITFAAHSRGGGVSQIGGLGVHNWREHEGNVQALILFASPRAGGPRFCRAVEKAVAQIIRYETRTLPVAGFRDAVPHVPLKAQGYDHPGKATYLRAYGRPSAQHDLDTYRKALKKLKVKQDVSRGTYFPEPTKLPPPPPRTRDKKDHRSRSAL